MITVTKLNADFSNLHCRVSDTEAEAMVGMLIAVAGRGGRRLVHVHETLPQDPLQTHSFPAGTECSYEEEKQEHRPCRKGYVEVVDEADIHPVHRVSHR